MDSSNHLAELRRPVKEADARISAQLDTIERMKRSGSSTKDAEHALRGLRRAAAALHGRLKILTAA